MNHKELGNEGESRAVRYLKNKEHEILDINFKWGRGELDIVSLHKGFLVITEVKTRNSTALGSPLLSITRRKQRQIIKITNQYIRSFNREEEVRFDVISIILNQKAFSLEHIEDAFYPLV